jgi:predicted DNA-binding antitoxin AbrB/MazE fold protein
MTFTVEAVFENGVLKPAEPLPLPEHARVTVTVVAGGSTAKALAGVIPCADPQLIEWAAMDAELDYPPPPEAS